MPRSFPVVRSVSRMMLCAAVGALGACSEPDSPAVSVSPPSAVASASAPSVSPAAIAPGTALPALSPAERGGSGSSIDRQADAMLKEEAGSGLRPALAGAAQLLPGAEASVYSPAVPDTQARLESLERSVADLRMEFDSVLPAIRELIEAGKADRIAVASGTPSGTPAPLAASAPPAVMPGAVASVSAPKTPVHETIPTAAAPNPVSTKVPVASPPPSAQASIAAASGGVTGVRVGVHPDRTRIVLDLSGPATFQTDLDNGERLLLVDLPQTPWSAPERQAASGKSLVTAWSAQSAHEGKGTTAVFQLSGPVKILTSSTLRPDGKSGDRIVIDLGPEGK